MKIIDFHLHPGYDFHGVITPEAFIDGIKREGISYVSGSVIHKDDSYRDVSDYSEIIPRLNREAYSFFERYPDMYIPGIQIHPHFVDISCSEIEYYHNKGARLVGELTPYLMAWGEYSDKNLFEILKLAEEKNMALSIIPASEVLSRLQHPKNIPTHAAKSICFFPAVCSVFLVPKEKAKDTAAAIIKAMSKNIDFCSAYSELCCTFWTIPSPPEASIATMSGNI